MGTNTDAVGSMRSVALELVDVWFRYPGLSDYVLRGVNLKITNGLTVIVGENGSVKNAFNDNGGVTKAREGQGPF